MTSFQDLFSHEGLLKAIEDAGYSTPTPIQQQAIPEVIKGVDLCASAQTGTGKTAAFILPSLLRLTRPAKTQGKGPRILILVPTRELAIQVAKEAQKYSKHLPSVKVVTVFGGASYVIQNRDLSRPYDILVATPGRLLDHFERKKVDFSRLEVLILDEADRMLDMGFIHDVETIAFATPKNRQTLLFSATLKKGVMNLSKRLLNHPVEISVASEVMQSQNIEEKLFKVDNLEHKYRLLEHLISNQEIGQAIVFTATKRQADQLGDKLMLAGEEAAVLHGDMRQSQRTKTIMRLRQQKVRILVATDVAARGIDVSTLTHVINFDVPMSVEDYVHRIGRTGRAGASGIALSFVSRRDYPMIRKIEAFTSKKITPHTIQGFEPVEKASSEKDFSEPFFRKQRRGGPGRNGPGRGGFPKRGKFNSRRR